MNFNIFLRYRREEHCMTREELAAYCDMSPFTIRSYEQGKAIPSIKAARKLSSVLGGTPKEYRKVEKTS